jgi:hypothetical protein
MKVAAGRSGHLMDKDARSATLSISSHVIGNVTCAGM